MTAPNDAIHTAATLRQIAATLAHLGNQPTWQRVLTRAADMIERLASRPTREEIRDEALEERIREDERDRLYAKADEQGGLTGQIAAAWLLGADAMPAPSRAALRSRTPAPSRNQDGETKP